ncbi:hypothetical protein WUBG_13189 [Wuchereria bancrofti]|uniref:Uncharacterized protein n=1 Tax=Wuchereria bancrofti TaxID=6293 RepID=J9EFV0_WUCBA|nr:hypothetical protein WUBG_13189 [Wuchereria bancrofti]
MCIKYNENIPITLLLVADGIVAVSTTPPRMMFAPEAARVTIPCVSCTTTQEREIEQHSHITT